MIVNANSIVQHVVQMKHEIIKHVDVNVKIIVRAKEIIFGILVHVFVRIASIYKSTGDISVITCYEFIHVMDIVSTKVTNTIATNVSIHSDSKKVRYKLDCYIVHTVLLVIILLLIVFIICYLYAKHRSKQSH